MDVHAEGTQSRVVVGSHLVPPQSKTEIPCRCTHDVHPIRGYRAIMTDVDHYSVASPKVRAHTLGTKISKQAKVWSKIHEYREALKLRSVAGSPVLGAGETSSRLSEVQEKAAKQLQKELEKIKTTPRQVGLAVVSEGQIRTIEMFDSPETYKQYHEQLTRRFIEEITAPKATSTEKVSNLRKELLKELRRLSMKIQVEDGKGTVETKDRILSSLQNKRRRLIHLCMEHL